MKYKKLTFQDPTPDILTPDILEKDAEQALKTAGAVADWMKRIVGK